jgi:DNA-binding transcriptional ArsR family regulator
MLERSRLKSQQEHEPGSRMRRITQKRATGFVSRPVAKLAAAAKKTKRPPSSSGSFALIAKRAKQASEFLKALSHESRLVILCLLCEGEKSVTELEELLSLRQSSVSQHLARLRFDGLVQTKRNGKAIHYSLANDAVRRILSTLDDVFCKRPKRHRDRTGKSIL